MRTHAALAVLLLVTGLVPAAVPAADARATTTLVLTYERTPGDPDSAALTAAYAPAEGASTLTVETSGSFDLTVLSSTGFAAENGTHVWDGETSRPTLTFRVPASDPPWRPLAEDGAWLAESDRYLVGAFPFLDTTGDGLGTVATEYRVAGEGYAADGIAYAGAHETHSRTVAGSTLAVVVPAPADPTTPPDALLDFWGELHRTFDVGFDVDRSSAVVLPSNATDDILAGNTFSQSMLVRQNRLATDNVSSIFAHEYVHTRLGAVASGSSAWLREASAEYYGHLLTADVAPNRTSFASLYGALNASGTDAADVVLANSSTWSEDAQYEKGAHVLAALDAQIRSQTDDRTLLTLLQYWWDGSVDLGTYGDLQDAVVTVTNNESMRGWLDRYVAGRALPPLPHDESLYAFEPAGDPAPLSADSAPADGGTTTGGQPGFTVALAAGLLALAAAALLSRTR